ncbi:MAG: response regulator transcription factor [Saprospiraceae bacterium]|nr:response regulator transcription factor [Saprospiraceae bacterium]
MINKISALAFEDDPSILKFVTECIQSFEEFEVKGSADNTVDAYKLIIKHQPDVVFSDISIAGGNVITEVFLKLKMNGVKIPFLVFISGHPEYGTRIINEYGDFVIKFIEKPFVDEWEERFAEALHLLKTKLNTTSKTEEANNSTQHHLFIKSGEHYIKLSYSEILWIEVAGNGGSYYVTDSDNHLVDLTLNKITEQLPKGKFIRISRDVVINLDHLRKVNKEERTALIMRLGKEKHLGIGDSYYSELLKIIKT